MFRLSFFLLITVSASLQAQDYNYVFVFLNSKPDKAVISVEEQEQLQNEHMQNIERLVAERKIIVAGPFDGGGGIFIFKTPKVSVAKEWLASDPAVQAKRWDIEMFPISFTKGGACLASQPYEMVTYGFVRVKFENDIANYKMNEGSNNLWGNLTKDKEVLLLGNFPQSDGGIAVFTKESLGNWLGEDQVEHITVEHKRLWVAKGSFCE